MGLVGSRGGVVSCQLMSDMQTCCGTKAAKTRTKSRGAAERGQRLRCPCNPPPLPPTRSPETTPGSRSPAPPAPVGSECPFSPWPQTGTTGSRSAQDETAGGAGETGAPHADTSSSVRMKETNAPSTSAWFPQRCCLSGRGASVWEESR